MSLLKRAKGFTYEEVTKERLVDIGQSKRHGGESELTEDFSTNLTESTMSV